MDFLVFMAPPIAMCLVLVGIHVYLGLHVIRREIIFVDIALAQFSALGAGIGLLAGIALGTTLSKFVGLGGAILAAWLISLTRPRGGGVPQEAYIGLVYAAASAGTILVLAGVPHGSEQIKTLLVGSILWVRWNDVVQVALLYAAIGAFHYKYRQQFMIVSRSAQEAKAYGLHLGRWDFLFYASLGLVVTQSVQVAGVLLVFTLLVVPAAMATLALPEGSARGLLGLGWVFGAAICSIGAALSYALDLPTGATIVCCFAVALVLLMLVRGAFLRRSGARARRLRGPEGSIGANRRL